MKLLFDEHLSHRLVSLLEDVYPGSESVLGAKLGGATDREIIEFAAEGDYILVSKDRDIPELVLFDRRDLKAIWLRSGNSSSADVHLLLRNSFDRIAAFLASEDRLLELP